MYQTSKPDMFKPTIINGRPYYQAGYYFRHCNVDKNDMVKARDNGLPFVKQGKFYYYNKQDFFDYWSGKIGNDVEVQK